MIFPLQEIVMNLTETTRQLLNEKIPHGTEGLRAMGRRVGCAPRTLFKFRNGEIIDTKAILMQRMYEDLSGKQLVA